MPIDTRFPQWMIEKNFSAPNNSVTQSIIAGAQIAAQQEQAAATREFRESQLRSLDAYRRTQINTELMKQKQLEAEQTDAALITEWMRDPRQPVPQGVTTPKGLKAITEVQRVFALNDRNSLFGAVQKSYNDKMKGLDAMGLLKVQSALDDSDGVITPQIATLIDTETTRMAGSMADLQVLDEHGQPFTPGGGHRAAFLRSTKTGALHRLPEDWTNANPVIPLKDEADNILGYGIRNASGGITQLRPLKADDVSAADLVVMRAELKAIEIAQNNLEIDAAEAKRQRAVVEAKYKQRAAIPAQPPAVAPVAPVAPVTTKEQYDQLPPGTEFMGQDGKKYIKP